MNLPSQIWLHIKSGNRYIITGFTIREADLALLVNYRKTGTGGNIEWSRPASEFFDGRMQIVV